jgi:hypothetical protein
VKLEVITKVKEKIPVPRRTTELNADENAQIPTVPEEAGGDGSASLFDAEGDARVRILRRDERTQKMVTHGFMEPTVSEEKVSNAFGGGHYRGQLFIPDPATGQPRVKRSRDFYIPGPYKPPQRINTMEDIGPNAPVNGAGTGPLIGQTATGQLPSTGELMQALNAGVISSVIDLLKSMREVKAPAAPVGPDPMLLKVMETQGQIQMKILELLMTRKDGDGNSKQEILDMMTKMKELVTPPVQGGIPTDPMKMFNSMLDTFKSFRDAAEDVSPPRSDNPVLDSIPKLVEVIAEGQAMQKQQAAAAVSHVPVPVNGGVAQMPQVNRMPAPDDRPIWKRIIAQQGARMLAQAAAKSDPDVIAGAAILFAPPAAKEALAIFFHRELEEVSADILAELPQMAEHREWLDAFVEAAQARLFPDEWADDEPETATEEPSK